jgi:N-methylhydantoinase A
MKRVAIDIGGTFTDVVGMGASGGLEHAKVLTTYPDPAEGFFRGLEKLGPDQASYLGHGTTLATNALLTRSGANVALVTTRGFQDVLEIRRTHRNTLFDIYEQMPEPLVGRDARFEVVERIAADGSVVHSLDEGGLREVAAEIKRGGYGAIAISFLFSFVNDIHERRARNVLAQELPLLADRITLSSETLPLHREYERTSTTVVSAMLMPLLRDYLGGLESRVRESGFAETLLIMQNTGGLVSPQRASDLPVLTLLSGPAGGAAATAFLGDLWGEKRLLALDMGGTSTDVSAVVDGTPETRLDFQIGEFDLSYPSIDIHTIGAGGGSQTRVDAHGRLTVGPESAGSTPGPACYGRGGEIPTVTDANVILGYLDPEEALGGVINVDRAAAERAIAQYVAYPLGLSVKEAALGITRIVNSNMMHALRFVSVERGRDPRDFALVPFGGAGPVHGVALAESLSMGRVLVPPVPGCNSAMGILAADLRHELVSAVHRPLARMSADDLFEAFASMAKEVAAQLRSEGIDERRVKIQATADLRYQGQAYELGIPVPLDAGPGALAQLSERFTKEHRARYGHALAEERIEFINARLTGIGMTEKPSLEIHPKVLSGAEAHTGERSIVTEDGDEMTIPVLRRDLLQPGDALPAPCLVAQSDATTLVPPGRKASVDGFGCLAVELT